MASRSKGKELRAEQRKAAYTLDCHVSVTAGPGAGKTKVLVERYLRILESQDVDVEKIVALTFTNRAANKMRDGLRLKLDERVRRAATPERPKWISLKRTFDGAIITTIHGFCARLLREFPIEAEVDPQFRLLEEHQSNLLLRAVTEEALTASINASDEVTAALMAGVGRSGLAAGLMEIYRAIRGLGLSIDEVAASTEAEHRGRDAYLAAVAELDVLIGEFTAMRDLTPAAEGKRRETESTWPMIRRLLTADPESLPLRDYCRELIAFRSARPTAQGVLKETVGRLDDLVWAKDLGGRIPKLWFDLRAVNYARNVIELLRSVDQRLSIEKRRVSALDFDDLQIRALSTLESHPEMLRRIADRYRYFLVDEFQDTNGLQRDLLKKLALTPGRRANVFIVGDRKQSIYGFRGADVDVFREMTRALEQSNGITVPLDLNFRSQAPLIDFFNHLFARIFEAREDLSTEELSQLGYVEHEPAIAERPIEHDPPLIELLVVEPANADKSSASNQGVDAGREREAEQLAARILQLVDTPPDEALTISDPDTEIRRPLRFGDFALLFRAMTKADIYETALRRAGVPFLTIQGWGFYQREEISDLIQLLRFLDNQTDELALAALLRSPLCGLSDNALLALRCAPLVAGTEERGRLRRRHGVRDLLYSLRQHRQIDFIAEAERPALDDAAELLLELIRRRNRYHISELLRFAIDQSEYRSVAAAAFDGPQRLVNIDKLLGLADRFEKSGAHLIRDFVSFIQEFEAVGGRESEAQLDLSADAVRLMTIHQSKGLEFPVVILPDLHRKAHSNRNPYQLDRHLGLSMRVPDGAGKMLTGYTLARLRERALRREEFESMRLLYVGSTRAMDRLILSAATDSFKKITSRPRSWLTLIAQALELHSGLESGDLNVTPDVRIRFVLSRAERIEAHHQKRVHVKPEPLTGEIQLPERLEGFFPLLRPIAAERARALRRFSVTQLLNYQRCPRQYYFDRLLQVPDQDALAFWNDAEAPEPPANLNATVRGLVIHRFCEEYQEGDDPEARLRTSLDELLQLRGSEWGERVAGIDRQAAVISLLPLAHNYLSSSVRTRIETLRNATGGTSQTPSSTLPLGVCSERRFVLRRPLGTLTGSIDKLLLYGNSGDESPAGEVIDFKTNRFDRHTARTRNPPEERWGIVPGNLDRQIDNGQSGQVERLVADYQVQMQAYCLAVYELMPEVKRVKATLHFLDPNVEASLPAHLLGRDTCAAVVDETMTRLSSSPSPEDFPVRPAEHCRFCNFLSLCRPGRQWVFRAD